MRYTVVIAAVVVAGGCVSTRSIETVIDEHKFQDTFGNVPIIQLGMSMKDVDRLVGCSSKAGMMSSSLAYITWFHSCGLIIDESAGKVISCKCSAEMTLPGPAPKETISERNLATMLQPGLTPMEVAEKIGQASCGFSTKPRTVNLWYQQLGIEIFFVKERLVQWRRVFTYQVAPIGPATAHETHSAASHNPIDSRSADVIP